MTATDFAHPEWIGPLGFGIASVALLVLAARALRNRQALRELGTAGAFVRRSAAGDVWLLLALGAIALALLGPRIGERTIRVADGGTDVVFLLDVSRSMDARDVPPSRLQRGRRLIAELLTRLAPGDRAALSAFGGRGLLLTPLTPDFDALTEIAAELEVGSIRPASSRLDRGIAAALPAFEAGSNRARVLVVVSDGEDPRAQRALPVDTLRRERVRVVTAAIGTEAGVTLPDGSGVLRRLSGKPVSTRRDDERLRTLAEASGGSHFAADEWGRIDTASALTAIGRDRGASGAPVERRVPATRVAPFALAALLLLLFEAIPRRRGRERRATRAVMAAAAVALASWAGGAGAPPRAQASEIAAVPIATAEARVEQAPEDARAHIELGLAYFEERRFDSAARAFLAATVFARDDSVATVAHFDLGVARIELGEFAAARDAFFDALRFDPEDEAARFNLEWTRAAQNTPPGPLGAGAGRGDEAAQPADAPTPDAPTEPEGETAASPSTAGRGGEAALDADERRRLLARVEDDTGLWLRSAGAETGSEQPGEPAW